jgi:hypothetical protein
MHHHIVIRKFGLQPLEHECQDSHPGQKEGFRLSLGMVFF